MPMPSCEMTFTGKPCGQSAWRAVGLIDPETDAYRCVLFCCDPCLHTLMTETTQQFRTVERELAHRLRARLGGTA